MDRYDVQTQQLLSPFAVGTALNGADITPDGQYLYATESQVSAGRGVVHRVNLDNGAVTNLMYNLSGAELGSWDLAMAANGRAFFTTRYSGSGATVPLHQIDLATDALSARMNTFPDALLRHGADARLLFGVEPGVSKGPIFTYDPASDSFHGIQLGGFLNNPLSAVNRDGTLIALKLGNGVVILDRNLNRVQSLTNLDGAIAFDPNEDILYAASSTSDQVIAFDTITWKELYRVAIGESLGGTAPFGTGEMRVTDDSSLLFVSTPTGVRALPLPASNPGASRLPDTVTIPPQFLRGDLDSPAGQGAGLAIVAPTTAAVSPQIPNGSLFRENGSEDLILWAGSER